MSNQVALIEFNTWHHECLYSQILFLTKSGYEVLLICDIQKKKAVESFSGLGHISFDFFDFHKLSSFFKLRKLLVKNGIKNIILNTAQGSGALKFSLLPLPSEKNIVGTIHNTAKLTSSIGQRIICKKLNAYYVLSEYIMPSLPKKNNLLATFFYPSFFQKEEDFQDLPLKKDCLWFCIPGSIEYKRRDYDFLFEIGNYLKKIGKERNAKFIILGKNRTKDGDKLLSKIKDLEMNDMFVTFDNFIPNRIFYAYLNASDYLLPLVHPNVEMAESYTKNRISGTFTIAKGFNKCMLCHSMFSKVKLFDFQSKFYETPQEFWEQATNTLGTTDYHQSLDFEENRLRYIRLLSNK
ncbi:MAG TPA: hypothetical protein PKW49_01855 [Paludibacteraceae bacterium]|nr:hypothetical protein [Paludibacteraceae bacterium]HQF49422.1 hypothetical protein [Paludibacteraceae bacterium]HQJ90139.1 hypothetical protein [Paludibacteraceae bacterium]